MTTPLRIRSFPRRGISIFPLTSRCTRRPFSNGIIEENDIVLLKRINSRHTSDSLLSTPLVKGGSIKLSSSKDKLSHDWIIGRGVRETVRSRRGGEYRLQVPTLAEHTDLWERLVTPIYSADAVATLALLDLNPSSSEHGEKLEIFEAGTGHGAFTLNLSRAIHAANDPPPSFHKTDLFSELTDAEASSEKESPEDLDEPSSFELWKETRQAIIHTLDRSPTYSAHARNMIKNFRKGMYLPNIDFHVGEIPHFITRRLEENRGVPFLDHAILDLPGAHAYIDIVSRALKPNGSLLVFAPQITQLNTCVLQSKKAGLEIFLDTVIELGGAMGVGGREWDVRPIRPRVVLQAIAERELAKCRVVESENDVEGGVEPEEEKGDEGWEMVCRPKVGGRVQGGGFVGQWRKMVPQRSFAERRLDLGLAVDIAQQELREAAAFEEGNGESTDGSEIPPSSPVTG